MSNWETKIVRLCCVGRVFLKCVKCESSLVVVFYVTLKGKLFSNQYLVMQMTHYININIYIHIMWFYENETYLCFLNEIVVVL